MLLFVERGAFIEAPCYLPDSEKIFHRCRSSEPIPSSFDIPFTRINWMYPKYGSSRPLSHTVEHVSHSIILAASLTVRAEIMEARRIVCVRDALPSYPIHIPFLCTRHLSGASANMIRLASCLKHNSSHTHPCPRRSEPSLLWWQSLSYSSAYPVEIDAPNMHEQKKSVILSLYPHTRWNYH